VCDTLGMHHSPTISCPVRPGHVDAVRRVLVNPHSMAAGSRMGRVHALGDGSDEDLEEGDTYRIVFANNLMDHH
jgi:hypothetical protein